MRIKSLTRKIVNKRTLSRLLLYLTIFAICIVTLFPLYWVLATSVKFRGDILAYPPKLLPRLSSINFHAYVEIFNQRPIKLWILNSFIVVIGTICLGVTISVFAGYSLSRFRTRGSIVIGYTLLVIRMLPATLLIIPLYIIFKKLNLIDNLMSLVIANTTFIIPFATWMLKGFFDSIPRELEEAAQIDGCSVVGALVRVVLPLAAPGLGATIIYCSILCWGEYLFALTFMRRASHWTITPGITSFIGEYTILWNELMAATIVGILPLLIVFLYLEKYLVKGLTAGAVK